MLQSLDPLQVFSVKVRQGPGWSEHRVHLGKVPVEPVWAWNKPFKLGLVHVQDIEYRTEQHSLIWLQEKKSKANSAFHQQNEGTFLLEIWLVVFPLT